MEYHIMKQLATDALKFYARRFPIAKGKNRLISLLWRPLSFGQYERQTTLRQADVQMKCDLTKMLQRQFYFFGGYEEEECRYWMKLAKKSEVIFDIGANVGLYSLLANNANSKSHIHAFEPTLDVFQRLQDNISLNNATTIRANMMGVGKNSGRAFLQLRHGSGSDNEGMNFVSESAVSDDDVSIDTISVDSYCEINNIKKIDLLKVDVEGGEYDVLLGAHHLLQQNSIKYIFMELIEWASTRSGHSISQVKSLLTDAGYQIYRLDSQSRTLVPVGDIHYEGNIIAVAPQREFSDKADGAIYCEACGSPRVFPLLIDLKHVYERDGQSQTWFYRFLECCNCGMGFVYPKPSWDVLQTFYDDEYGCYATSPLSATQQAHSFKYRIARMRFATLRSRSSSSIVKAALGGIVEVLTGRTVPYALGLPLQLACNARIFELGYGGGDWLLSMAELGYTNMHGYDIDANTQNVQRLKKAGISVSSGSFENNDYEENSFDCIRLEHVFEHLLDPVEVLKKCHVMLRPGGFLVMSLPSLDAWNMITSMDYSPALQLPKHLFLHTPTSTRQMLRDAGFRSFKVRPYAVVTQLGGSINGVLQEKGKKSLPRTLVEASGPLYKWFGELTNKGDFLAVWAKK